MKVNALPLCALECEDGRVFSDITFVYSFSYSFPSENGLDFRKGNRMEGVDNCLYLP